MRPLHFSIGMNDDSAGLAAERTVGVERAHFVAAPRKFGEDGCAGITLKFQAVPAVGKGLPEQEARRKRGRGSAWSGSSL